MENIQLQQATPETREDQRNENFSTLAEIKILTPKAKDT